MGGGGSEAEAVVVGGEGWERIWREAKVEIVEGFWR